MQFPAKTRNMIFLVIFKKISEKKCFDFFDSRLKKKLVKHWWESWLTPRRYFDWSTFVSEIFLKMTKKIIFWVLAGNFKFALESLKIMKIKEYWKKNHENWWIDEAKHYYLRIDFGTFLLPVELICAIEIFLVFL